VYRVIKDHGADHFQVDHHLQNSTYRLVSCNIATPPAAASCHPDLMKLLKSRKFQNGNVLLYYQPDK